MKLKFRSKFNHGFTNHGYFHSAAWKALYNFKMKRAQEARHNQFFFQNVQNNEVFEISKMFKKSSWINVYYTKSKYELPWTNCFVSDWKYLFWANLVQNSKTISLSWNLLPGLSQIWRILWCPLFLFLTGNTFLGKFGPKNQNWQFQLKFCTRLIWICRIMLKICVHIFFLRPKKPFFGKSGQKNQICQFKLKSGTKTNNLNMRNSITVISWANLGEKFKIVCSKLHLIQRLIRCLFLGKFGPKICNCQFKLKIGTYTNLNMKNSIVVLIFFCFWPEVYCLLEIFARIKIFCWSWNLESRLIWIYRIRW